MSRNHNRISHQRLSKWVDHWLSQWVGHWLSHSLRTYVHGIDTLTFKKKTGSFSVRLANTKLKRHPFAVQMSRRAGVNTKCGIPKLLEKAVRVWVAISGLE
jgi:hypothetical protein